MYDPRAIANLILDEAERLGIPLSNLPLQKLLYFAHGVYLTETKKPLVSGYFEAWQHGPVHPAVYKSFKVAGDRPITFRAVGKDALTGRDREIFIPEDAEVRKLICRIMSSFGHLPAGLLVDISHAKDGPWAFVVDNSKSSIALSMRITDNLILDRFKFHKVSVGAAPRSGDPLEDTPLPETDLAAIAPLPLDEKRKALEVFRLGRPPHSYSPVRASYGDLLNLETGLFGALSPVSFDRIANVIRAASRHEKEAEANIRVAAGLYNLQWRGRRQEFSPVATSTGQKLSYWSPVVLAIDDRPVVPFFNPRQMPLSPVGLRFVMSMMHEQIRVANPDYSEVVLCVCHFAKGTTGPRRARPVFDVSGEYFSFAELQAMVAETYEIWAEVCFGRAEDARRRSGSPGGFGF